jgi:hypothetical protein
VEILWQNGTEALVGEGLKAGDQLVLTALGQVNSGTRVQVVTGDDVAKEPAERRGNGS